MTTAVATAILDALRIEVPVEMERRNPAALMRAQESGRCIQATRVGIDALAYFGIPAKPLVTLMMCGNAAWCEWMLEGGPQPMPDEVWSVGIDPNPNGKRGFPAHLVIEVDGYLLDLDAGLYDRPHKGIHIPPTLFAPLTTESLHIENGNLAGIDLDEGGGIIYGQHHSPPNYKQTGAWRNTKTWAGPVIRRMRTRLEE